MKDAQNEEEDTETQESEGRMEGGKMPKRRKRRKRWTLKQRRKLK